MHNEPGPVVDRLPGLAWTAAADGRVDSVNRPWCAYTGHCADAALGDGWQSVVHPDDLPALLQRWTAILHTGQAQDMQSMPPFWFRSDRAYDPRTAPALRKTYWVALRTPGMPAALSLGSASRRPVNPSGVSADTAPCD